MFLKTVSRGCANIKSNTYPIVLFQEAPLNEQVNSETPVSTENYAQ